MWRLYRRFAGRSSRDSGISLGLGLTNECNLKCAFCYRDPDRADTYEEYWQGFRQLLESTDVIAIGEPLVRAMAGLPPLAAGCGLSTVRITPRATSQPCVYWSGWGEPLADLILAGPEILNSTPFDLARTLPEACQACEFRDSCHGGCAGRRRLQGALAQPDSYCPIIRGHRPTLTIRMAASRDLPKLSSSCTTVVIGRDAGG